MVGVDVFYTYGLRGGLFVGSISQLSALSVDSDTTYRELHPGELTWSSSNLTVVRVSSAGSITAVGAGRAEIYATYKTGVGSLSVTVQNSRPSAFVDIFFRGVEPRAPGETGPAVAQIGVRDVAGAAAWASSDERVATVGRGGVVTAVGPGMVTITATAEGLSGMFLLSVLPRRP